jgi:hypothetical protein
MDATLTRRRAAWCAGALGLAAGAVALTFAQSSAANGSTVTVADAVKGETAQVKSVEDAFTAGIRADRAAQAPASAAYTRAAAAALAAGRIAPAASAAERQSQLDAGISTLSRYFTPAQAAHEEIGLRNAVALEGTPGFRNLGSGASTVTFLSASVTGTQATIEAHVTAWAKFQTQSSGGQWMTSSPVNTMDYTATLVRDASGQWRISSLRGDFVPGEGP